MEVEVPDVVRCWGVVEALLVHCSGGAEALLGRCRGATQGYPGAAGALLEWPFLTLLASGPGRPRGYWNPFHSLMGELESPLSWMTR